MQERLILCSLHEKAMPYQTENCPPPYKWHDTAADHLVAQGCGPVGLTAGKIIDSARFCFN